MRIVFVGIFSWLICAPGAAIAALITPPAARDATSSVERGVLGFGVCLLARRDVIPPRRRHADDFAGSVA